MLSAGATPQALALCQLLRRYSGSVAAMFKSFPPAQSRNPRVSPKFRRRQFRVTEWRDDDPERTFVYSKHFKRYEMEMNALQQLAHYEEFGRLLLPPGEASERMEDEAGDASHEEQLANTREELLKAEEVNAEWNAESGRLREAAMLEEYARLKEAEEKRQLDEELLRNSAVLSFQERLRRDLADSAEFIDESNLDEKVEQALDSPIVGFNFAVDPAGRILQSGGQANSPPV